MNVRKFNLKYPQSIYLPIYVKIIYMLREYIYISLQTMNKHTDIFLKWHEKLTTNSGLYQLIITPQSQKFMVFLKPIKVEFLKDQLFLGLDQHLSLCITKHLAKFFSPRHLVAMINKSHMKSHVDLLNTINNINMENKSLASLHMKSLYTNIPVKNASNVQKFT